MDGWGLAHRKRAVFLISSGIITFISAINGHVN
jgi:hypothetical protein